MEEIQITQLFEIETQIAREQRELATLISRHARNKAMVQRIDSAAAAAARTPSSRSASLHAAEAAPTLEHRRGSRAHLSPPTEPRLSRS